jgi:hypothetical protein
MNKIGLKSTGMKWRGLKCSAVNSSELDLTGPKRDGHTWTGLNRL